MDENVYKNDKDYIEYLYNFITEQVIAGLFKTDIVDKLIDMGLDRDTATELVEEFDFRLRKRLEKKKILVVEDEEASRMLLLEILKSAGFAVVEAADGEEALKQVKETLPDLIITDVLMPKMKGDQFVQKLKNTFTGGDIPVIVVSQRGPLKDYMVSLEVDAFVDKPIAVDKLLVIIDQALQGSTDTPPAQI